MAKGNILGTVLKVGAIAIGGYVVYQVVKGQQAEAAATGGVTPSAQTIALPATATTAQKQAAVAAVQSGQATIAVVATPGGGQTTLAVSEFGKTFTSPTAEAKYINQTLANAVYGGKLSAIPQDQYWGGLAGKVADGVATAQEKTLYAEIQAGIRSGATGAVLPGKTSSTWYEPWDGPKPTGATGPSAVAPIVEAPPELITYGEVSPEVAAYLGITQEAPLYLETTPVTYETEPVSAGGEVLSADIVEAIIEEQPHEAPEAWEGGGATMTEEAYQEYFAQYGEGD